MVTVRIPTPLRSLAGGKEEVSLEGKSIAEVIDNLERQHQGFRARLCDANGALRRFINLYVNERDIRDLQGMETELKSGDAISIIPAIAGGRA